MAAIASVPRVATILTTTILPIWNIPFSIPLGIPILRILTTNAFLGIYFLRLCTAIGFFLDNAKIVITTPATTLLIKVASATPATPIPAPKTNTAFSTMLIAFISKLMFILILLLPTLLKIAAPALYIPRNGYERAVMNRYVLAQSITSFSIEPKINDKIGLVNTQKISAATTEKIIIIVSS